MCIRDRTSRSAPGFRRGPTFIHVKGEVDKCRSPLSRSRIALSSRQSRPSKPPHPVWLSQTPLRKSLKRAKLSQSAPAALTTTGCLLYTSDAADDLTRVD